LGNKVKALLVQELPEQSARLDGAEVEDVLGKRYKS
jgi:hypothetical protein